MLCAKLKSMGVIKFYKDAVCVAMSVFQWCYVCVSVMFAYEQCLLCLGHHPDIWYEAASYLELSSKLLAEKGVRIQFNSGVLLISLIIVAPNCIVVCHTWWTTQLVRGDSAEDSSVVTISATIVYNPFGVVIIVIWLTYCRCDIKGKDHPNENEGH